MGERVKVPIPAESLPLSFQEDCTSLPPKYKTGWQTACVSEKMLGLLDNPQKGSINLCSFEKNQKDKLQRASCLGMGLFVSPLPPS